MTTHAPAQPLADHLKTVTADAHRRAERAPVQRMLVRGDLPRSVLTAYLGQLRHIHAGVEHMLESHPRAAALVGWSDRFRHAGRLEAALVEAGMDIKDVQPSAPVESYLDKLTDTCEDEPLSAAGAFYVLEGSMNGNRFIARALARTCRDFPAALRYFDPYGDDQPTLWAAARERLNSATLDERETAAIVQSALWTFQVVGDAVPSSV